MYKILSCLCLFVNIINQASAQSKQDDCCKSLDNLTAEDKAIYKKRDCHRYRNNLFLRQTLIYAPLSYVCGPRMEWQQVYPRDHYILSADIVPQFVIGGRWMPIPIHFTPRFMARIFYDNKEQTGDSSLPVRTPSYMPGATAYFPLNSCEDISSTSYLKYLSLSVFHHSNGQDGNEFNGKDINHYNGNFSTNFVEVAYNFRRRSNIRPVLLCDSRSSEFHDWYGRVGVEQHFGTADSLKSSYGDTRLNMRIGWLKVNGHRDLIRCAPVDHPYHRETYRMVLNATYIMGKRDLGLDDWRRRWNADLSLYRRIPGSPNTAGVLAVGYFGSDPYNIFYDTSPYFFVRLGLAIGFFYNPLAGEPQQ